VSESAPANVSNETWLEFVREATATKRAIEEATGRHRSVMKRAKAAGCSPAILALAIQSKRKDPAVMVSEIRDTVRVLNLVNVKMTQADLFGGWEPQVNAGAAAVQALFDAEERGYAAGKAGAAAGDNPYQLGTEAAQCWGKGWSAGKDAAAAAKPAGTTQADASRKRPQRSPAKAAAPEPKKRAGRKPKGDGEAAAAH
jgi:ribosome modulation factor